ncbi:MAG: hypothetical protein KGD58_10740, partial [Candidatus Lokiarchaeota archaeon]|nr:hypothetical protein [Candidatus Lokiarchaeota archaeon]
MYKNTMNFKLKKKLKNILIITSVLSLVLLVDSNFLFNFQFNNDDNGDIIGDEQFSVDSLKNANGDSILFEGSEQALIINDTGLL